MGKVHGTRVTVMPTGGHPERGQEGIQAGQGQQEHRRSDATADPAGFQVHTPPGARSLEWRARARLATVRRHRAPGTPGGGQHDLM